MAVSHGAAHGNRAAAREYSIHESMARKWRKQEDDLHQVKKTTQRFRGKLVLFNVPYSVKNTVIGARVRLHLCICGSVFANILYLRSKTCKNGRCLPFSGNLFL